jgi:hypothetical protein
VVADLHSNARHRDFAESLADKSDVGDNANLLSEFQAGKRTKQGKWRLNWRDPE